MRRARMPGNYDVAIGYGPAGELARQLARRLEAAPNSQTTSEEKRR